MEMLIVNNHIRSWISSKHWNENTPSHLEININILLGWELSAPRQIISAWQLKREISLTWNKPKNELEHYTGGNKLKRRAEAQKPKLREGDM